MSSQTNQAWQIASPGRLVLNDTGPVSTPGPSELLIRIHAIALNYRDILVTDHDPVYPTQSKENLIPASDGAGIIVSTGPNTSKYKVNDRVIIHPNTWLSGDVRNYTFEHTLGGGDADGTLQKFMVVNEELVFRAPEGLSYAEASTLFGAGATAWNALFYGDPKLEVGEGTTVLTQGTGGVSCYAIQIAAAAGATVIATSSSDSKLEHARKLGATHLINYRTTPDWSAEVLKVTNGVGVDVVVDVVGGADLAHSIKSLRLGGRIGLCGMLDKEDKPIAPTTPLLFGAKTSKLSPFSPFSRKIRPPN